MAEAETAALHQQVLAELEAVSRNPYHQVTGLIFERAEAILPRVLTSKDRMEMVVAAANALGKTRTSATYIIDLLLPLLEPYEYSDILELNSGGLPLTAGLGLGDHMSSFNMLVLAILEKATKKLVDAAHVATLLDTMLALVRLWLCTKDTGVANRASSLLLRLLKVEGHSQTDPVAPFVNTGQNFMWKRIFGDRDVYATMFKACSLTVPSELNLSKNQITLAQARLLEWLPLVGAMDWSSISRSHHPEIESIYGVKDGLLEFAAIHMVERENDVLMHRCLLDFYSALIKTQAPSSAIDKNIYQSPALQYLVDAGIHARTVDTYLQSNERPQDAVDVSFLYGPAANYVATYVFCYRKHFLASQMPKQVNDHLYKVLDMPPERWMRTSSPKHDFHVLASLPRQSLLRSDSVGGWHTSPLSLLPSRRGNEDSLNTLATIFRGPPQAPLETERPAASPVIYQDIDREAAGARALYYHYIVDNPTFWRDVVGHLDRPILSDQAHAAVNCMLALIDANWSSTIELPLPTTMFPTPRSGHLAILSRPALEYAIPWLLQQAPDIDRPKMSRIDCEGPRNKIALMKFDALKLLHEKLQAEVKRDPDIGFDEIRLTILRRLNEGRFTIQAAVDPPRQIATARR